MKLQDKETNEIIEIEIRQVDDDKLKDRPLTTIDGEKITLEKLKEKYVDYEEPIEFWTIDIMGMKVVHIYEQGKFRCVSDEQIANLEELGLKFKTEKEAEQALEKLKAWQRLRDKGARFKEWFWDENYGTCIILGDSEEHDYVDDTDEQIRKDLDLLFGGEQ